MPIIRKQPIARQPQNAVEEYYSNFENNLREAKQNFRDKQNWVREGQAVMKETHNNPLFRRVRR